MEGLAKWCEEFQLMGNGPTLKTVLDWVCLRQMDHTQKKEGKLPKGESLYNLIIMFKR